MAKGRPEPKIRVEVVVLEAEAIILTYQPIGFWLQPVKYQIIKEMPLSFGETCEFMTEVK